MTRKGFTAIELLITAAIFVIVMTALITASIQMRAAFHATEVSATLQEDARLAINAMTMELRKTSRTKILITQDYPIAGSDQIKFNLPADSDSDGVPDVSSGEIVWDTQDVKLKGDTIDGRFQLIKKYGVDITVLADNLKRVSFIDFNRDSSLYLNELRIILELEETDAMGRTFNRSFTSIVNMRN
jgi:prepilin-type N-terminal cleavage/methylation domain-containing protein